MTCVADEPVTSRQIKYYYLDSAAGSFRLLIERRGEKNLLPSFLLSCRANPARCPLTENRENMT